MITVSVDGRPFSVDFAALKTMGELVEFVKANIDPDLVITSVLLNGADLSENEWRLPLSALGEKELAFCTGSREQFIADRLDMAALYLDRIRSEFERTKSAYKEGVTSEAHSGLSQAVQDLRAFIDWYGTVIQMLPPEKSELVETFNEQVKRLTEVCEQILQQQLYRAWWALSDTLEKKLDPELERLKSCCLKIVNG